MIAVRFTPDIPFVQGKSHRWGDRVPRPMEGVQHDLEGVAGGVPTGTGIDPETTM